MPSRRPGPFSAIFPFVFATDAAGRVPGDDFTLLQVGARSSAGVSIEQLVEAVISHYGQGISPLLRRVAFWAEADPLSCYDDCHRENMSAIKGLLPAGLSLIGSDYCLGAPQRAGVAHLQERLHQSQTAARAAIEYVRNSKRR